MSMRSIATQKKKTDENRRVVALRSGLLGIRRGGAFLKGKKKKEREHIQANVKVGMHA